MCAEAVTVQTVKFRFFAYVFMIFGNLFLFLFFLFCSLFHSSNNTHWVNAVKETKIVFLVRDNSGEKCSLPTQTGEIFCGYLLRLRSCRPFLVLSHAWKVLALRSFPDPASPAPFKSRIWWVGTIGSQRPVLIFGFLVVSAGFFPSAGRAHRL